MSYLITDDEVVNVRPGTPDDSEPRTSRRATRRSTPNWLKAVYALILGVIAIVALSMTLAPHSATPVKTQDNVSSYNDGFADGKGECK